MKFKIIPEEDANTQTIVLKTDGGHSNGMSGLDGIIGNWVSEQLRKSLDKSKDDKKDDDKKKPKVFSKAELMCWSLFLMFTAPWTGLWIVNAFDDVKLQWAKILLKAVTPQ